MLYSDGIIEARDKAGRVFDVHGLQAVLKDALGATSDLNEVVERVITRVKAHCAQRDDDWTLLLVRKRQDTAPGTGAVEVNV